MPLWPFGAAEAARSAAAEAASRAADWERALSRGALPPFVEDRLAGAAQGRVPWLSTMTPAELRLARSHGIRPVATVSGTCWYHYGFSWTKGHAEGWRAALDRLAAEAVAAGANAVVDVKLRTIHLNAGASMDYTVLGTAVAIDGLPPSPRPVIATVPATAFVRLLEAGIVTTGVAVGAHYEWLTGTARTLPGRFTGNVPCSDLTAFWENVRLQALRDLRAETRQQGNGVLAHTHFSQLLRREGGEDQPPQFLGRHIVVGTVVQCPQNGRVPHGVTPVIDMRDALSPLNDAAAHGHVAYGARRDEEGAI